MALPKKTLALLRARDPHCYHCGIDGETLVVQHRINRGMGSSKLLDGLDNLMLICSFWNSEMESTSADAAAARGWGHKLSRWQSTNIPVFDLVEHRWWTLKADGTREPFEVNECF